MPETYCGKKCEDCIKYQRSVCASCKNGPGTVTDPHCEIADCCITRNISACASCAAKDTCVTLDPDIRTDSSFKSAAILNADRMMRIFKLKFAYIVIGVISFVLLDLDVWPFSLTSLLLITARLVIAVIPLRIIVDINFIKLGTLKKTYMIAGVLRIFQFVLSTAEFVCMCVVIFRFYTDTISIGSIEKIMSYTIIWDMVQKLVVIVDTRFEYCAHGEVMAEYSYSSGNNWRTLFILQTISICVSFICEYANFPTLVGSMVAVAGTVIDVFYLIYLYKIAVVLKYNKNQYLKQNT